MKENTSDTPQGRLINANNLETTDTAAIQASLSVSLTAFTWLCPLYEPGTDELTDFAFDYLNPAGQRIVHLPERPETTFLTAFTHARETGAFAFYRDVFETGATGQFAVDYQHDGRGNYFRVAACRQGSRLAVSYADYDHMPDETALSAARYQMDEREKVYQVFEQTPGLVVLLRGPEHRIEYHNAAYQQLFLNRALRGRTVAEIIPEAERQGFVALLDGVYETGEPYFGVEMPFTVEVPGGQPPETHYFTFTFQRYEENGQPAGVSEFAYDVTAQVRGRAKLEAQRKQLERLFMQAPASIAIWAGPELVFEFVNPGYQQLFPGRQLLGLALLEALPEMRGHISYVNLVRVYETGNPHEVHNLLVPIARPSDGVLEDHYFNYIQQPRYSEEGKIDGVIAFAYETTSQVRASQQVQALNAELMVTNQQLTRTNADLDTFIYTASHDLKAPVANIEGLLAALLYELPAEAFQVGVVQPMFDRMQGAVERFKRTINQLTDVARLQQVQAQPVEQVDLALLIEDLCLDLAPLLVATGAQLTLDIAACPQVSFAPQHLRSIIYNLLSNALKYRHPARPPHVQLRCRSTADAVVLEVEDNGLGLTQTQQGKLFGLFRRLHDHVEGTGVGLYTIKRIVENAGGTVTVQSEVGIGSTFTVILPHASHPADEVKK